VAARASLVLFGVAASLAGCIGTGPTDPVTTEAQAIAIAKERCEWTLPFEATERWHAARHEGLWHVWLVRDSDPREPAIGVLDIWIHAGDGKAGDCNRAY
jgi:hypothetical protein